jgi:hypothetical protein
MLEKPCASHETFLIVLIGASGKCSGKHHALSKGPDDDCLTHEHRCRDLRDSMDFASPEHLPDAPMLLVDK